MKHLDQRKIANELRKEMLKQKEQANQHEAEFDAKLSKKLIKLKYKRAIDTISNHWKIYKV